MEILAGVLAILAILFGVDRVRNKESTRAVEMSAELERREAREAEQIATARRRPRADSGSS
jgi:hypothetical protein